MIRLYREGQLGERQSAPDLEIFSIGDRVCQPNPITGKNWGMLGEPGIQVFFDMLKKAPQLGTCLRFETWHNVLKYFVKYMHILLYKGAYNKDGLQTHF